MKKTDTIPAPLTSRNPAWTAIDRKEWQLLAILLLAGTILRILYLGRCDLWQDEMGFISLADPRQSLSDLARQSWQWILSIGQQPLGFMLQNLYMKAVSGFVPDVMYNPFWARLHWMIWGVAGIGGVYAMARAASGKSAAWMTAVLYTVSFYPVFYAREIYPYAGVMTAAAFTAFFSIHHLFITERPWRSAMAAGVSGLILVYLHLNGVLFFGVVCAVVGLAWLKGFCFTRTRQRQPWARQATRLVLVLALTGLAVSPFVLRFVLLNEAHTQGSSLSLWSILQDPVAKFFLGERLPFLLAGWLAVAAGCIAVFTRRANDDTMGAKMLAAIGLLAWLFIGFSTSRSQYLSARYFAPIAPVFFWLFAEGLLAAGRWFKKKKIARAVPAALTGLYALVHLGIYLPGLYALQDKDIGFGKIADWLNNNLEQGTPFLMESAYELRWVSGYHPTPGLIGAAPYVHVAGEGELERLHQRQTAFMLRFPESPFVQSAHHHWDAPGGVWPWPRDYHTRHAQLRNDPLRTLMAKGIFPSLPFEEVRVHSFITDIFYSTWEDIDAREAAAGSLISYRFPGWFTGQVAQGEYRRVLPGNDGQIIIKRLPLPHDVTGTLSLGGVVYGQEGAHVNLTVTLPGYPPVSRRHAVGQRWRVDIPLDGLPATDTPLHLRITSSGTIQGLVLDGIAFAQQPAD